MHRFVPGGWTRPKQFLAAAESIEDSSSGEIADAYVTLCVHAGIAAADVICCARLGRHAQGDSHVEAVALLNKANAADSARRLEVLLGRVEGGLHAPPVVINGREEGRLAAKDLVEVAERA
ncbi:MAG: hypothetical protein ACR2MN_03190 [Acidimicrobiales bacterium]